MFPPLLKHYLNIGQHVRTGSLITRVMSQNSEPAKVVSYNEIHEIASAGNGYIIDVRRREEIKETGSIPSSVNVPLHELEDALNMSSSDFASKYQREKPEPSTKIIFSCRLGGRSAEALKMAIAKGYNNAYNYSGGWTEWHARKEENS